MNVKVGASELRQWRARARERALAANLSPQEVDWLLVAVARADKLALRW